MTSDKLQMKLQCMYVVVYTIKLQYTKSGIELVWIFVQ